jgi:tRNA pseudouridine55 synthase
MEGALLVDKPAGWTSFDVVNRVRFIVARAEGKKPKYIKVGHTGTLDPAATGLLLLLVGKNYTRRAPDLVKKDKFYEVEMTLGKVSTTGDTEGEITDVSDLQPTEQEIKAVLAHWTGDIMQIPPAFSAIKIDGQRAYDLARKGQEVKIEPRPAIIHANEFQDYTYPVVHFTSHVGSGTYIRSLVEDIGKQLGTGAYMSALRRTRVADYDIKNAVSPEGLTAEIIAENFLQLPDIAPHAVAA